MTKGKHGGSRRGPNRSATRGRQGSRQHPAPTKPEEMDLVRKLRAAMRQGDLAAAAFVSELVEATAAPPERDGVVSLAMLIESLIGIRIAETTAALHILAALVPDELQVACIRRELPNRHHPMPLDVAEFANLRVVRAAEMRLPHDVGDDLMLELQGPGVRDICVLVYIDHRRGTFLKDAFVMPDTLDGAIANMTQVAARDGYQPDFAPVALADARARLEGAITAYENLDPPMEPGDTWPGLKPLLRFLVRHLPEGGTAYPADAPTGGYGGAFGEIHPEEEDRYEDDIKVESDDLAHFFLNDDEGQADIGKNPLDHELAHMLAVCIVMASDEEYRWDTVTIATTMLRDLPRMLTADPQQYARALEVLPAFVRFCHEWDEVEDAATEEALATIERLREDFLATREDPDVVRDRQALIDAAASEFEVELDGDGWSDHILQMDEMLVAIVGSREILEALDDAPLPDEALDVSGLPADIVERVCRISALADGAIDALYPDVELRTACRRFTAKVAAADPVIFRRKGADDTAAAALVWIVAKANEAIGYYGFPAVGDLMAHFGRSGSPSGRAHPMLTAAGAAQSIYHMPALGDTRLLTSRMRRLVADRWDRLGWL